MALRTIVNDKTGEEALWNEETGEMSPVGKRPVDLADPATIGRIVKGAGEGVIAGARMPLDIARGLASARNIDPRELSPGVLWEAAKDTGADIARGWPEIVGGMGGGFFGGPWGAVGGAAGMRGVAEAIGGASPQEVARGVMASATTGAMPLGMARGLQAAPKITGRGLLTARPDVEGAFARQGIAPTAANVSGSRLAAGTENILGRTFYGGGTMQGAEEGQLARLAAGIRDQAPRATAEQGAFQTGKTAIEAIQSQLDRLKGQSAGLKAQAVDLLGEGEISARPIMEKASALADELEKVRPGIRDTSAIGQLRQIAKAEEPAVTAPGHVLDAQGRPIVKTMKPARDLSTMTFDEWDATMQALGEMIRDADPVARRFQGRAKALYAEGITALDEAAAAGTIDPAGRTALNAYKDFYRTQLGGFNESFPGRLLSGKLDPEDVVRVMRKDGVTELKELKQYAPDVFPLVRDVAFGRLLENWKVIEDPSRFAKRWRSLTPEVKQEAFGPELLRNLDDLATVAETMASKKSAQGGGNPSASGLTNVQAGQATAMAGTAAAIPTAALTGRPGVAALSAGMLLLESLGPYGLAKLMTTPGGIRHLTTAFTLPAGSREAAALLGIIQAGQEGERRRREFLEVQTPPAPR